jgi:hypothetical protein
MQVAAMSSDKFKKPPVRAEWPPSPLSQAMLFGDAFL